MLSPFRFLDPTQWNEQVARGPVRLISAYGYEQKPSAQPVKYAVQPQPTGRLVRTRRLN